MKYIVLKGASNVGKTTTLGYLREMIKCETIYDTFECLGKDFITIYKNYKGLKIAIVSKGDDNGTICENMKLIFEKCKKIDVIFCASRLYRKGEDYFKKIKDGKIEIIKGYVYTRDDNMIQKHHKQIASFLYKIVFE